LFSQSNLIRNLSSSGSSPSLMYRLIFAIYMDRVFLNVFLLYAYVKRVPHVALVLLPMELDLEALT
jgi:hypothetical protein